MMISARTYISGVLLLTAMAASAQDTVRWDLTQCINYALEHNLTVKQAELSRAASDVTYKQSRMNVLPSLSANGSYNIMRGNAIDPVTYDKTTETSQSTSLGANASVQLFGGGQNYNQIKQNRLSLEKSELYIQEEKNSISLSIAEAYIQAIYSKENIKVAENNAATSQQQYDLAKARYERGAISRNSLADVQSQLASDQYNLISARNNLAQQILTLKQLLELEPGQEFDIVQPDISADSLIIPDKMDIYNRACEIMPEIQSGNLAIEIAEMDVKLARGNYMPSLSLSAGINTRYSDNSNGSMSSQFSDNVNENIGLNLNIPIFNKFSTRSRVQSAKIQVEQSQLNLTTTQKTLYKNIEQAWLNAISAQGELYASKLSRDASEEAYSLARQQFKLGALSTTELLNSQNTYLNAESQYLQKKFSCLLYYQLIQFYQGNEIKI